MFFLRILISAANLRSTRLLLTVVLALFGAFSAQARQLRFSEVVKASLVFRESRHHDLSDPHVIEVYLRLENIASEEVTWFAFDPGGVDAELLDAAGHRAPQASGMLSQSGAGALYQIPYGSTLDWYVSSGGFSFIGDVKNNYELMIGQKAWLIPLDKVNSYSLRVRLSGTPWVSDYKAAQSAQKTLLKVPPTKIRLMQ